MDKHAGSTPALTITVLGGTGRFGAPYIHTFLDEGLDVRILARCPQKMFQRFTRADVRKGDMMNVVDVKKTLYGVAAAFLITPVGGNDDVQTELRAARCAIEAARAVELPHLIYLSLIQPSRPAGVPMLEVKGQIEEMIMNAGVPYSSLRTGCYMDTWLSFFPMFMKLGLYLMPIAHGHQFSFTSQRDVARLAVTLIRQGNVLNGTIDVIETQPRRLMDVVNLYRKVSERKLVPAGRWLLPVLTLLRPCIFRWIWPKGASRVRLFNYFSSNDWVGNTRQMSEVFPGFQLTSMRDHLRDNPI